MFGLGWLLTGALVLAPASPADNWSAGAPAAASTMVTSSAGPVSWEHSYRLSGKVWLLFWVGRDDLGTARLTRRTAAASSTISFIGGSDPRRAPGNLNQWGVAIEAAAGDRTRVFVARSLAPDDLTSPERRLADGAADAVFGATCASIERNTSRSSMTGVRVDPAMSFRSVSDLLDLLASSRRWESTRAECPADASPGFFTAVLSATDESVARARRGIRAPARSHRLYVFKGALFDLDVRKVEAAGPGRLRQKFTYRNRTTGDSADFYVTVGTEGALAGVPVEMAFNPSWWLRVQLRLDDSADVPGDPSQDVSLSSRIDHLCTAALGKDADGPDD